MTTQGAPASSPDAPSPGRPETASSGRPETPSSGRGRPETPSSGRPDVLSSVWPPRARASEDAGLSGLVSALTNLRDTVRDARFPLPLASAEPAQEAADGMAAQVDDYLLPRLDRLDAPLLVVVGGSTGAGKSTLVNSLIRTPVSLAGVLRPTTRAPVLVCNPADLPWFSEATILPSLMRITGASTDPGTMQVVSANQLTEGLALLDAPDIDSIVDANRALAGQLLAAADLWLFVTTASRYADAVPWGMLRTARTRGTAVALVLDRVPGGGAADEIGPHLTGMLRDNDLNGVPLFVLPEARLDSQGLLEERTIIPLRDWFSSLARSAAARAGVVRRTVSGAVDAIGLAAEGLADAADDQQGAVEALRDAVKSSYRAAAESVEHGVKDGALLRGEVLTRWQELVGTGDIMRALQARMGRVRDRVLAAITGRPMPGQRFQEAIESGLGMLIRGAATDAADRVAAAWKAHPAGRVLLTGEITPGPELPERIGRLVREWERDVLELVRTEAGARRNVARASAYAVNGTGLLVMIAVFAATAFIPTGLEVVVAGGTTIAAQKVLEAIFGDQAVRELAEKARTDLLGRVRTLLDEEAARHVAVIDEAGLDAGTAGRLRDAAERVRTARSRADLPPGGDLPMPSIAS